MDLSKSINCSKPKLTKYMPTLTDYQIRTISTVLLKELATLNKKSQEIYRNYLEEITDYDSFIRNFNSYQNRIDDLRRIVVELNYPGSDYNED